MALEKSGYSAAIVGTSKMNYGVDEDGYLAPEGTTAAGVKSFQITKVNADNSATDNSEVLGFFLNLANGQYDTVTNTMTVKWEV